MYIENAKEVFESKDLFQCKSINLKKFLCEIKKMSYVYRESYEQDGKNKYIWFFVKNEDLSSALNEWSERGKSGDLIFKK